MSLPFNQFLAVVYADLFDYPLSLGETKLWAVSGTEAKGRPGKADSQGGYYFLRGRRRIVELRKRRERMANSKAKRAVMVTEVLAKILTVEAVFLTGSVAVGNATGAADVDLMIVTKRGTLWLTRAIVVAVLRFLGSYGNTKNGVCTNIFLDCSHLEVGQKDLYTAHEVLLARCLFDRGKVEMKWLRENSWTGKYLPVAFRHRVNKANDQFPIKPMSNRTMPNWAIEDWIWRIGYWPIGLIELCAFLIQYFYQLPKQTNERLGRGYAYFHPRNLSEEVKKRFDGRLRELSIMRK